MIGATRTRLNRWLGALLGAVLLALLLAAAPADAVMYWGATIKGSVYGMPGEAPTSDAVLSRFEEDAGKQITFVNTGQQWAHFDPVTMEAAIDVGAIPLVTMGLSAGVTLADVVAGEEDTEIREWAQAAKAFGYPFLFRPWWESNGDWYSWGRDPEYVAAWRHFHDVVEDEGATNVTWAWVVNAIWWNPASDPTPYYPGDAYVDWVGMDAYNWGLNPIQPDRWLTPEETIGPTLDVLDEIAPGKPVCICEDAATEIGGDKAVWIAEMLGEYLPSQPSIKAYLWFNWNIEQNGGLWDWPIESSAPAELAFREGIQDPTYLSSLPLLTPLAKVPMPTAPGPPASDPEPEPEPPRGSPAAEPDPPVEKRVRVRRVGLNRRRGTARVWVRIPGPGTVALRSSGALAWIPRLGGRPARRSVARVEAAAATVPLRLRPTPATRRKLARTGRARVTVTISFAPAGGAWSSRTVQPLLRVARR